VAGNNPLNDVYLPEVLFEFQHVGKSVRVTAIDPITRTEVIMVAPAKASRKEVKHTAAKKLAYVLKKKQDAAEGGEFGGDL